MQRFPASSAPVPARAPLILLFERNDAVAVPLIPQLRTAGYDVRAARIPVEVFDLLQREPVDLVLVDLSNAAANRREFWVGLDSQRRTRTVHVLTFRYMTTLETGELEAGLRVARADVEIQGVEGFGPLIDALHARVPGAVPVPRFSGPPLPAPGLPALPAPAARGGNVSNNPLAPRAAPAGNPLAAQPRPQGGAPDDSPFAQPYSSNPLKGNAGGRPAGPPPPDPFGPRFPAANGNSNGNGFGAAPPVQRGAPARNGSPGNVQEYAGNFGSATPVRPAPPPERPPINDAWQPPEVAATPQRGIAYRGYDDPLAPDDPRIEDSTSPVPIVAYRGVAQNGNNERALSTILMDSAAMAPQRLDALKSVQQTLAAVGMEFTISELALLFKFLTPDQLLAALLVSRGLVPAEEIASLGRIKQELLAAGKDYDLQTLLVMFNVLPAEQVRDLREELGFTDAPAPFE